MRVPGGRGISGVTAVKVVTEEDLTIPVDYDDDNSSTVVDPPADSVFSTQAEWDNHLITQGASAYKHIQKVFDALPTFALHDVIINCAAGVHRPFSAGAAILESRIFIFNGTVDVVGDADTANWTVLDAGGTITGHQTLNEVTGERYPYLDFDADTFPNDGSLNGRLAVTSDGFIGVIWEHTDSRLWVTRRLNPVPTDGVSTAFVAEQGTVFTNSIDDTARSNSLQSIKLIIQGTPTDIAPGGINAMTFSDIAVRDFSSGFGIRVASNTDINRILWSRVTMDKVFGPVSENGEGWHTTAPIRCSLNDCSFISTIGGGADSPLVAEEGTIQFRRTYIQGGEDGCEARAANGAKFNMLDCVLRGVGSASLGLAALRTSSGGSITTVDTGGGVVNTILESPDAGIEFSGGGHSFGFPTAQTPPSAKVRFRDNVGPCVRILDSIVDMAKFPDGFIDDGGNLDVGIEVVGPHASLILTTDTDVAGANGAIRFSGEIKTYADLVADGPFSDLVNLNRLEQ